MVSRAADRRRRQRNRQVAAALVRISVTVSVLALLATWASSTQDPQWPAGARFTTGLPTRTAAPAAEADRQSSVSRAASRTLRPVITTTVMTPPPPGGSSVASPVLLCHVSYSVATDGPTRFVVVLVVANTARSPLNGWSLRWAFPADQQILYGWNALVSIGPAGAVATNIGSNGTIPPGGAVTLGFIGVRGTWIPTPTTFSLNGNPCLWQPTSTGALTLPNASTPLPAGPSTPSGPATPSTAAPSTAAGQSNNAAGQSNNGAGQEHGNAAAAPPANDRSPAR
jgi:hypothetical protein